MKSTMLFLALILTACAQSSPTPATPTAPKTLFATWTSAGDPNWTIDFPDAYHVIWTYGTGGKCDSDMRITWFQDQDYGQMTTTNSMALISVSGMPDCSQFDGTWLYYVLADSLVLCKQNSNESCVNLK